MKPLLKTSLPLIALMMIASPAFAQNNRFSMTPSDDGFLRLDTHTGAVSICNKKSGTWKCESLAKNGGDADISGRMAQLTEENKELKAEVEKLEQEVFKMSKNGGQSSSKKLQLPTEEDVDKVMSFMERMIDRFKTFGKKLREDDKDFGTPL